MHCLNRMLKFVALASCGGTLWVLGSGTCLPDNFWPGFLGDTIITGVGSALLANALAAAGL